MNDHIKQLETAISEITEIARGFGLDFYPMRYEICPADIINTFGAYGMPTRFSHWSFGKAFHRIKMQYDLGLSKIYELVINSNPCYAFLLEGNSLIQNKLIIAHVLAHCDFFKNNTRFARTNRDMVESMSASADRFRGYVMEYGANEVEGFIDATLSIQEHIDPSLVFVHHDRKKRYKELEEERSRPRKTPHAQERYADLWDLEKRAEDGEEAPSKAAELPFPPEPEKDIMWFIEAFSSVLKPWQQDILSTLREEMLYFWPQMETKIMNEGWASYWHIRILRELDLPPEDTVEYSKLNASVVQPSTRQLNPYYLGFKIFEDIERRWDNPAEEERERFGRKPGQGRAKIFEVREFDMDTSFLRNYLTKKLVEDLDLYVFEKKGAEWKITDKSWENVRDQLVYSRVNGGFPYITVNDGDYLRNGELYLKHAFEGMELDIKYMEKTLPHVHRLWGKTVHLETVIEGNRVIFTFDGQKHHRKFV